MRKFIIILFSFFFLFAIRVSAENITSYSESAILIESSTGKILYEKDADLEKAPASMTKIMSMILIMDAIHNGSLSLEDKVLISENASSMGGSQVYLNTGESYKVSELLKSIAIASANDSVVAMAEKIAGTEEKFVEMMNNKCKELGCTHTNFVNPHGLDDENHYSSARDMALMGNYLVKNYPDILKFTSIYEDYLQRPDGSNTWLVNTNKLVRFYEDVDGLKTGFTSTAGYCLTSTAMKNNMRLIGVVMGVDTPDNRTSDTVKMLNYGFNSYKLSTIYEKNKIIDKVRVEKGKQDSVKIVLMENATELLNINEKAKNYTINVKLEKIIAPVNNGDKVGEAEVIDNEGKIITKVGITVANDVQKANLWDYFKRNLNVTFSGKIVIK
ncbi:MAG: D-alanyl-D-alanine carboxypeptidase [Firmicutes bacterium]|nr:D-alanyl-D-alanine carboxypeptidase [Bacillota bacterium]